MRRWVPAAGVVLTLALATPARADDAATKEAQARFKEGLALAEASKFEEARLKFLQAYSMSKAPSVLYNLATTERKTGHDVEAAEHYRTFLKSSVYDARINDATREAAKKYIAELLEKLGRIDVDAPDGTKISVDGKALEEPPSEPIVVTPGKHKVEGALGGKVMAVTVESAAGQIVKAKLEVGASPPSPPTMPPASEGPVPTRTTAGWVVPLSLAVAGIAAGTVGAVFASAAQSSKEEFEAMRRERRGLCATSGGSECSAYDAKRDDAEGEATASYVGYAAGGLFVAGAVATYLLFTPRAVTSSSRGVVLTPHAGGGTLQLRF